jgi:hypothetical protein
MKRRIRRRMIIRNYKKGGGREIRGGEEEGGRGSEGEGVRERE